jgi:uncharacterized membrane protein YkvI
MSHGLLTPARCGERWRVFEPLDIPAHMATGFVLQSVIIGGGYATGRELVEFFLSSGPVGGLLGMLAATIISIVCAVF